MSASISNYDELTRYKGKSIVSIEPVTLPVVDVLWGRVVGKSIMIPGGCELRVDEGNITFLTERLDEGLLEYGVALKLPLLFSVLDPAFPSVTVAVSIEQLSSSFNLTEQGSGPRVNRKIPRCLHPETDPPALCEYCFRRWWRDKAASNTAPVSGLAVVESMEELRQNDRID